MSSSSVSSQTWLQNFRPYVNGEKVRWPDLHLHLVAGECIDLTLEFEYSYLIGDPESPLKLCCEPDADSLGLVCDPPFGQLVEMAEGLIELTWHICATGDSNSPLGLAIPFNLHYEMPLFQGMPPSPGIPGSIVGAEQQVETWFDTFPVYFGSSVYPCHGAKHTVKVVPKPESDLIGKEAVLLWGGRPAEELGVIMSPSTPQPLSGSGTVWELNCEGSTVDGAFSLIMAIEGWEGATEPLSMSLGHNLVTVERWITGPFEHQPGSRYFNSHIRATSVFTKNPASNVEVLIDDKAGRLKTGPDGEASDLQMTPASLSIVNKYNGLKV